MLESILFGYTKKSAPIGPVQVSPPVDNIGREIALRSELFINGTEENDAYGNQYWIKFDSSEVVVSAMANLRSEIYAINSDGTLATLLKELPARFALASNLALDVFVNWGPTATGLLFKRGDDGTYEQGSQSVMPNGYMDSKYLSPKGDLISDQSNTYAIDWQSMSVRSVKSHSLVAQVFSEDGAHSACLTDTYTIERYAIDSDYNFTSVAVSELDYECVYVGVPMDDSGAEIAYNHDLSTLAYISQEGVVVLGLNPNTNQYETRQLIDYSITAPSQCISMDRAGHLLAFTDHAKSTLNIWQLNQAGVFTNTLSIALNNNRTEQNPGYSHKCRISPDGRYVFIDEIYYNDMRGRLRVIRLY